MDNINNQQERREDSNWQQQQLQQQELTLNRASTTRGRMEYAPGYRFCPSDEELIMCYLRPMIDNRPLPFNGIPTIDLSSYSPDNLKGEFEWDKLFKENEMYVFTSRSRKYPNGSRPNRTAARGYWKPTGVEKSIIQGQGDGDSIIGYKKQLDYYLGNSKDGKRTFWKMHEYRVDQAGTAPSTNANGEMDKQLDKCVLCKIYLSSRKKDNGEAKEAAESITNSDNSSPQTVEETNETSSTTYEPNNMVQMYGNQEQQAGNSVMNANNNGQITSTFHSSFAWPAMTYNYPTTSNSQMFDQNGSFIDQSSRKRAGESNMNGQSSTVAPSTLGWPVVSYNLNNHDHENSGSFYDDQSFGIMFDYNGSSMNHDQSLWKNSHYYNKEEDNIVDSSMNANNHDGIVQSQNHNNLISSQMFDQDSYNDLMDLRSCFNDNIFPAVENFSAPMTSAAHHVESNYHQLLAASDFSYPCMYTESDIGEVSFDTVKDCTN